jgi:hypothetical protein
MLESPRYLPSKKNKSCSCKSSNARIKSVFFSIMSLATLSRVNKSLKSTDTRGPMLFVVC